MTEKLLAVFDLDHTLVRINSHYYFAERFLAQHAPALRFVYGLTTQGLVGKVLSKIVGCDARKWVSLRCFGCFSAQRLSNAATALYGAADAALFNEDIVRLLRSLRDSERHHVVLMSATPDFIARVFAQRLEVACEASTYRRGRLAVDLTGKKVERALAIPGVVPHLFVSDNPEDINSVFPNYMLVKDGVMYQRRASSEELACP